MIKEKVLAAEAFVKAVTEEDIPEDAQWRAMRFLLNDDNYPMPDDIKKDLQGFVKQPHKSCYPHAKRHMTQTGM
jgi:hypothetical protein